MNSPSGSKRIPTPERFWCIFRGWNQRKMLDSILSLIAWVELESDAYTCKNWLIVLFYKWYNKIPVGGDLGASPPQRFGRGGDRPHRPHGVSAYAWQTSQKHAHNGWLSTFYSWLSVGVNGLCRWTSSCRSCMFYGEVQGQSKLQNRLVHYIAVCFGGTIKPAQITLSVCMRSTRCV